MEVDFSKVYEPKLVCVQPISKTTECLNRIFLCQWHKNILFSYESIVLSADEKFVDLSYAIDTWRRRTFALLGKSHIEATSGSLLKNEIPMEAEPCICKSGRTTHMDQGNQDYCERGNVNAKANPKLIEILYELITNYS